MRSWYVVYARAREEAVAAEHLARQNFEVYWPRYRRQITHARRLAEVTSSLFPRYLFVRFDAEQSGWRVIKSTRGVVDLVRQGPVLSEVPAPLIDEIKAREGGDGCVVLGRQAGFKFGQPCALTAKAFKGHDLVFQAEKDSERVVALFNLLGREFRVEVPIASLAPVGFA